MRGKHLTTGLDAILRLKNAAVSPSARRRWHWLVYFYEHGENISLTARHFGIARCTLRMWIDRFDPKNPLSLDVRSRSPQHVRKPETDHRTIELLRALRMKHPAMGKVPLQKILQNEHGIELSVSTVGRILTRHGLYFAKTASHRQKLSQFHSRSERLFAAHENTRSLHASDPNTSAFFVEFGLTS